MTRRHDPAGTGRCLPVRPAIARGTPQAAAADRRTASSKVSGACSSGCSRALRTSLIDYYHSHAVTEPTDFESSPDASKLAAAMNAALEPMRERRREVMARPDRIREIAVEGSRKARGVAQQTMERVRDAVKLRY